MHRREIALRCALELINFVQVEMPKGKKTISYGELGERIGYDNQRAGQIIGSSMCTLKEFCAGVFSEVLGCKVPFVNALVVTADGKPTPEMFMEYPVDFEKCWNEEIEDVRNFKRWDEVRLVTSCMILNDCERSCELSTRYQLQKEYI